METKISSLSTPLRNNFWDEWGRKGQGHLLSIRPGPGIRGLPVVQQPSYDPPPNGQSLLLGVTLPPYPYPETPPPA